MRSLVIALALIAPVWLLADASESTPKVPSSAERMQSASAAYAQKDYAKCAEIFGVLGRETKSLPALYNAASCLALNGDTDAALIRLGEVLDLGWTNTSHLEKDPDLASLRDDPRWKNVIARSQSNWTKKFGDSNRELWSIMEADQADRESTPADVKAAAERDRTRRKQVATLIAAAGLKTSMDHFNAALVMQHGENSDDYRKAHDLALRAVELDSTNDSAKWLAAASQDRYLHSIGKPQIYGTQFRQVNGVWVLDPIDETAVTDAERARWHVPPLADAKRRAQQMNKQ